MRKNLLCIALAFVISAMVPTMVFADMGDVLSKFHPYLTLQQEYTDNFDLVPNNRQDDWITTAGLGLRYSTSPPSSEIPGQILSAPEQPSGVDLDYMLGLVFYANNSQDNYVSHNGRLNAWTTLEHSLTLRLQDYFIRSEEPRERDYSSSAPPGQLLPGTEHQRAAYIRNVAEPSLQYRFGREDLFTFNYRNNIYQTQNTQSQNSQEDFFSPSLTYWFDIRHGVTLQYGYTLADFERDPDFTGHMASGQYIYRFNPHTSAFAAYTYLRRDFKSPGIDYEVQNPSIGINHSFSPTLNGSLQVGYFWQNPSQGKSLGGFSGSAALTKKAKNTTYSINFFAGYLEDYYSAENLGFTKTYRAIASVSHALMERLTIGALGSVDRFEYTTPDSRKDWSWRIGGNAAYRIFRWLDVSLEYYHQDLDSNIDINDYKENRVILRANLTI